MNNLEGVQEEVEFNSLLKPVELLKNGGDVMV